MTTAAPTTRIVPTPKPAIAPTVASVLLGVGLLVTPAFAQCEPEQVARLIASDGAEEAFFGFTVAVSGETAVIGAPGDAELGLRAGAAYVFQKTGNGWFETAKLLPGDGHAEQDFGTSVAIDGDTIVVGAMGDDENGVASGSAYIFERHAEGWSQTAKLFGSEAGFVDQLGFAVAISGNTVIVSGVVLDFTGGNNGSAYVFEKRDGVWTEAARLRDRGDELRFDGFGWAVSLSGNTAVVSARWDGPRGLYSGSAYVFERGTGDWAQTARLSPSDGAQSDIFGLPISISGDTIAAGARGDDDLGESSGSVYIFERGTGGWTQTAKLLAEDGAEGDHFGATLHIDGDGLVVGAERERDPVADTESAYVFHRTADGWTQTSKFISFDGVREGFLGQSVSICGDTVLVGSRAGNDFGIQSGTAYAFDLRCDCPADFDTNGTADIFDIVGFLNAWNAMDPETDLDHDGGFTMNDILAFLTIWNAGCP